MSAWEAILIKSSWWSRQPVMHLWHRTHYAPFSGKWSKGTGRRRQMAGGWVAGDSIPNLQWLHCVGWRPEGPRSAIQPRLLPASLWALVPTSVKWAVASGTLHVLVFFFRYQHSMFLNGTVPWYFKRFWNYENSVYLQDRGGLRRSNRSAKKS